MHVEWTDKLSDYLDDDHSELTLAERREVDGHLAGCADCARTLAELRRVVEEAQALRPRPPAADLWAGVAKRLAREGAARQVTRVSFTLPQLAAAAVLIAAVSGALAFVSGRREGVRDLRPIPTAAQTAVPGGEVVTVGFADAQYDAAVADLEAALKNGRGKLDRSTIAALEQSLQTIDQAIDQARQALAADPANTYLSGYLVETRRRKLDLLRRATALTETD
jgi:tetratricopeptide (TPR) repeat protein